MLTLGRVRDKYAGGWWHSAFPLAPTKGAVTLVVLGGLTSFQVHSDFQHLDTRMLASAY